MKKHRFQLKTMGIAALVTVLVAGSVLGLVAWRMDWFRKPVPTTYPYVFVHGLGGWGEDAGVSQSLPYWGANSGDLMQMLRGEGYTCHAPSVGASASAWDRACELYAALTGTRVDYGAAHAKQCGHERYGKQYDSALVPDWGSVDEERNLRRINLIGHSFGGATIRLFSQLVAYGNPAEQEAAQSNGTECSPLFEGGKEDWIYSITTLAAPHNGTTLLYAVGDGAGIVGTVFDALNNLLDNAAGEKLLHYLQRMGFPLNPNSADRDLQEVLRLAGEKDNAYNDLTLAGAERVNAQITINPHIYYYSYAFDGTKDSSLLRRRVPTGDMMLALRPSATIIGGFTDNTQSDHVLDESWLPNDGLVNTKSQLAPFQEPDTDFVQETQTKGVWQVMPVLRGDHGKPIGLMQSGEWTLRFYQEQLERIDARSRLETGTRQWPAFLHWLSER